MSASAIALPFDLPTFPDQGPGIDTFAGPGGWSVAAKAFGLTEYGVEWDAHACATARAAGHHRAMLDVSKVVLDRWLRPYGWMLGSPPCQGFSQAGKGDGRLDRALLLAAITDMLTEDPDVVIARLHATMKDDRSVLVLEPLRWLIKAHRAGQPVRWFAFEQVPAVLPVWEACAFVAQLLGYNTDAQNVQAEQYGVPQTRKRAIWRGTLDPAGLRPLVPTHSKYHVRTPSRLDPGVQKWVSMAEALGWGMTARPSMTVTGGGTGAGGAEPFGNMARQGMVRELEAGRWQQRWRSGPGGLDPDLPATTVSGDPRLSARSHHDHGEQGRDAVPSSDVRAAYELAATTGPLAANDGTTDADMAWVHNRPSPTIVGSFAPDVVAAPGYRTAGDGPRQKAKGSVRVTVQEAAVLQSFPADYPWQGSKTAQYRQVGDAVPPLLAAAIIRSLVW